MIYSEDADKLFKRVDYERFFRIYYRTIRDLVQWNTQHHKILFDLGL